MAGGRVNNRAAPMASSMRIISVILGLTVLVAYISTSNFNGTPSIVFLDEKDVDGKGRTPQPKPITLLCANGTAPTCPSSASATRSFYSPSSPLHPSPSCPEYFRWIHEDLRPWRDTGISREVVESAKRFATMRLVVLDGHLYVEEYQMKGFGRNVFTIWGILQLLQRYPGRVPDLDLMFNCMDLPAAKAADYIGSTPPALFHYCNDNETLDINFPDWSFWGMSDQNVKPWESVFKEIQEGNQIVKWIDREPYAFWKGNRWMGDNRKDLMKCNISKYQDWNARLFSTDWTAESKTGFKKTGLKSQCVHRYKIYVEGISWSVSQKNILACDSPALVVTPRYHEFFTRALVPGRHYWPIQENNKCRSIKFAVDWGNKNPEKAQAIGKAGSSFIQEQLKMELIYDYMLHTLNQYAKLLTYKPTVPKTAREYCLESVACPTEGRVREFLLESRVKWTHDAEPCTMPPPYSPAELQELLSKKAEAIKQVEMWERGA